MIQSPFIKPSLLALVLVALTAGRLPGVELGDSSGVYVDSAGGRHKWFIDSNHTLIWRGKPFIPVGGMFCFRYLSEYQPGDSAGNARRWKGDLDILKQVAQAGIKHLYLNPVNPATRYPVEAWNRCMGILDRKGFQYGIEITDGPQRGMEGYLVGGDAWKAVAEKGRLRIDFTREMGQVPKLLGVLAVTPSGSVVEIRVRSSGKETVELSLPQPARQAGTIFIPKVEAPTAFNVPNLWDHYEKYERRLIAYLSRLHRGPGLRFIVDPLTNELNLYAYTGQMVPSARAFRRGFQAWLQVKYRKSLKRLQKAWGGQQGQFITGWEVASRAVPLPDLDGDGRGRILDPESRVTWPVTIARNRVLEDIRLFRDASIGYYCRRVSATVRRRFADVPVIYKHTGLFMRFLVQDSPGPGMNGIGMEAWGKSPRGLAETAGPPLAVLRHWNRPGWLLATETAPSALPEGKPPGYENHMSFLRHMDSLVRYGARGLYLFALRPLPEEGLGDYLLYRMPNQLKWLKAYADELWRGNRVRLLQTPPKVRYQRARRGLGLNVVGWEAADGRGISRVKLDGDVLTLPALKKGLTPLAE